MKAGPGLRSQDPQLVLEKSHPKHRPPTFFILTFIPLGGLLEKRFPPPLSLSIPQTLLQKATTTKSGASRHNSIPV